MKRTESAPTGRKRSTKGRGGTCACARACAPLQLLQRPGGSKQEGYGQGVCSNPSQGRRERCARKLRARASYARTRAARSEMPVMTAAPVSSPTYTPKLVPGPNHAGGSFDTLHLVDDATTEIGSFMNSTLA